MEKSSVEEIVRSLNRHQVQYLIVGGLAVVAHGYVRLTADVDLMLALDAGNLTRAIAALRNLDYRPRAPVRFEEFIDPATRQKWAAEKNMTVFSLFSPAHPATEIDLFLEPPIDFAAAYSRCARIELNEGLTAPFCGIDDLVKMKSLAGRPRDLEDIAQLNRLRQGEQ